MRVITFKISEELLEALDKYALKQGKPRSVIIREAIKAYLTGSIPKSRTIKIRRVVLI